MVDVLIIGKGPAGITASIYTARAGLNTIVVGGESWLAKSEKIDNYYGFENEISGKELLEKGESQAKKFGVDIINEQVLDIAVDKYFTVKTQTKTIEAKSILLSTGLHRKRINIENIELFEGKGIHYCVVCDGFFYRGKHTGILGNGDYAVNEAIELQNFSDDITIYTNGKELELSHEYEEKIQNFKINTMKIKAFEGEERLSQIRFENDITEEISAIFVAGDTADASDFAKKIGIVTKDNSIVVDANQQTNIKGIFSAGDCTGAFPQIGIAVGQGVIAGTRIIEYVKKLNEVS